VKICFVFDAIYPYSKGGVEKRIHDLSRNLARSGNEIHVIGTQYWEGSATTESAGVFYHGIDIPSDLYTNRGKRSAISAVQFALRLIRPLAAGRYDVIETQSTLPLTTLVARAITRAQKTKLKIFWHEVWDRHWTTYSPMTGWAARLLERLSARLDVVHAAPSVTTALRVQRLGHRDVTVVPISVDTHLIERTPPSSLESDVLYVGRLTDQKNLDLLLDAVAELGKWGKSPNVTIVGDGPEFDRLVGRSQELRLESVGFLGRIESDAEVYALMKSSRVLVQPSLREGFGLVVLEAAMCGLPAIAVDSPENAARELLDRKQLVEPGSPRSLALRISEFLSDESQRLRLAEQAKGVAAKFASQATSRHEMYWADETPGRVFAS
jgi:glycosyltransferase involved in cell wall biosynthesis